MDVRIRCQYLGLTAAFALALSISAAAEWSAVNAAAAGPVVPNKAVLVPDTDDDSPMPAPVLFVAGGLLAVAAMVRWRQKIKANSQATGI